MLYGAEYPGDHAFICGSCETREPSNSVECDSCGRWGCNECIILTVGEQDPDTGYTDDKRMCGDCIEKMERAA